MHPHPYDSRFGPLAASSIRRGARQLCALPVLVLITAFLGCDPPYGAPSAPPATIVRDPPIVTVTRSTRGALEGDHRVSATCSDVTVTSGQPREAAETPYFYVDVAVETRSAEAMILDLFRPYSIADWRVAVTDGVFRHELQIFWDPLFPNLLQHRTSLPGYVPPMIVSVCPEGRRGPVLACTERSCREYADEAEALLLVPESRSVRWIAPWGYAEVREVREGEVLEIPISYVFHRNTPSRIDLGAAALPKYGSWNYTGGSGPPDVELSPASFMIDGGRKGDTGTVVFRLRAIADGVDEREWAEGARIVFGVPHPLVPPNELLVRIVDAP